MNEEEFFNRMINRICKDYGYEVANSFKLMYLKKDKQLEAYENMRKKLKNRIEYTNFKDVEDLEKFKSYLDELMNILNKVGGSDE